MNPSKTLKTLMVLLFIYMLLLSWFVFKPVAVTPVTAEIPGPEVKVGNYTIFQYTSVGWANKLYITEYYIKDGVIYYRLRDNQSDYLPVDLENCLIVPEWIENIDELMDYGFWIPGDEYNEPYS
jgi:hypothetical protein